MGGMVSAQLAANHPDRIVACIWIGPVYPSPEVAAIFSKRIELVSKDGMEAMANTIPYMAPAANAPALARVFIREVLLAQDPAGYISNCRVIAQAERPPYEKVQVPLLLLAGEEDKSAPLKGCKRMFDEVKTEAGEKRMVVMKGVGKGLHGVCSNHLFVANSFLGPRRCCSIFGEDLLSCWVWLASQSYKICFLRSLASYVSRLCLSAEQSRTTYISASSRLFPMHFFE